MIQQLTVKLLRVAGRTPRLDPRIPDGLLVDMIMSRGIELLRGLIRTRQLVLLASSVRIRGRKHVTFGKFVSIGAQSDIDGYGAEGTHFADGSRLGRDCVVTVTSHLSRLGVGFSLGENSGMGDYCHVGASGGVRVGRNVIMGSFISMHSQDHLFADPEVPIRLQGTTERGIVVGDDCWIGARVTILDGTEVGSGCVVAAGAVLKGKFPPNSLIAGVPARVLRSRVSGDAPTF